VGPGFLLSDTQRRTDRHDKDDSYVLQILPKHIKKRYPNWKYRYVFKEKKALIKIK